MIRAAAHLAAFVMFAAHSVPAEAAQASPEASEGRWNVDWGERMCSVIRESTESPPNYFAIQAVPGSYRTQLRVVSRTWPRGALSEPDRVLVTFHPQGFIVTGDAHVEETRAGRAILFLSVPQEVRDAFGSAGMVRLTSNGATLLEIPLPGSARAMAAFRECETQVLRHWGVDPAAAARVRTPPRGNLQAFVRNSDYPAASLRSRSEGSVTLRLDVDEAGRVTDCAVLVSSGAEELDSASCRILRSRAYLAPALDGEGLPIPSALVTQITWRVGR